PCSPSCPPATKPSTHACSDPDPPYPLSPWGEGWGEGRRTSQHHPMETTMTALHHIPHRTKTLPPLRVGIGGPVGSGKTTLLEMLCKSMRDQYDLIAITNDIYTKEDQRLLTVSGALPADRIMGVETGGCPHTAIREDCSINLEAIDRMLGEH